MSDLTRVIIQAAVTQARHPRLFNWWRDGSGDKGAVVRLALEWFFDVRPQMDRIETMLEILVNYTKENDNNANHQNRERNSPGVSEGIETGQSITDRSED